MPPLDVSQMVLPVAACAVLAALAFRIPRYRFALMGLVAIVAYAMLMDQVSARLCPEYFTVLHRPIPGVTNPTLLGVCWGFLDGWWGGIVLGYSAGLFATLGPRPQLAPRELLRPMALLVLAVAVVTALTGFTVWRHAEMLGVQLDQFHTDIVPVSRHRALLVVACYHLVAYVSSALASVVLCIWVWHTRQQREHTETLPCKNEPSPPLD